MAWRRLGAHRPSAARRVGGSRPRSCSSASPQSETARAGGGECESASKTIGQAARAWYSQWHSSAAGGFADQIIPSESVPVTGMKLPWRKAVGTACDGLAVGCWSRFKCVGHSACDRGAMSGLAPAPAPDGARRQPLCGRERSGRRWRPLGARAGGRRAERALRLRARRAGPTAAPAAPAAPGIRRAPRPSADARPPNTRAGRHVARCYVDTWRVLVLCRTTWRVQACSALLHGLVVAGAGLEPEGLTRSATLYAIGVDGGPLDP